MIAALSLVAVGLVLVVTAGVMEASHYPWGILFGTAAQDADAIPDPSPITLDSEDQDIIITEEVPTAEAADASAAAPPSETPPAEASPSEGTALPGNTEDTANAPAVNKFVILGTLKIPVLNVSQNLLEGAGKQMKYGVGHVPSTAAPGQKGNCAVSGHRPYPFRYLDQLKTGDKIVIKAGGVTYTYEVYESFDVLPTEVWVLSSIPGEDYTLTVITCTPYMVSSHRLIVRARLVDVDGQTPQAYYGETTPEAAVSPTASAEPGSTDASDAPAEVSAETAETADPFVTPADQVPAAPSAETAPSEDAPFVPD
jgi:sortase A